jgi:hypothetical protein
MKRKFLEMFAFRKIFNLKDPKKLDTEIEAPKDSVELNYTEEPEAIEIEENNLTWGLSFDHQIKNIQDLVQLYRQSTQHFELDDAIEEIVNEAIVTEEGPIVELIPDSSKLSANIKKKVVEEFEGVTQLLNFQNDAQEIFRRWYIDGRLFYQNVIDEKKQNEGIKKLVRLSPLDITRVKQVDTKPGIPPDKDKKAEETKKTVYLYRENDDYRAKKRHTIHKWSDDYGYEVPEHLITYVPSGITDPTGEYYISNLHKALKPLNQLRLLEDAAVIYRITRAPERRVFYIDVGKLPKTKAEEYVRKLMNKFKNKISYDANTGQMTQKKDVMTMLEDFYLPTTSDQRGTKVETLDGGQQLGEIDDIFYFKKKLYKSLKVPVARIDEDSSPAVDFGRSGEITRQELKFTKFVKQLRHKFSFLLLDILKKQVIMKGIMTADDWRVFAQQVTLKWASDSYFTELKENEILNGRMELASDMQDYIGKYFSNKYVKKHVFRQSDDEMEVMKKEIADEEKAGEIGGEEEEDEY